MSKATSEALRDTERWFVRRGIPHFIADYSATTDIFTRAAPLLTFLFLAEMFGAINFQDLDVEGHQEPTTDTLSIADVEAANFDADINDLAAELMAHRHRHGNRRLCPVVPLEYVNVSATDGRTPDLDQDVVMPDFRNGDVFHPDAAFGLGFDQCFHYRALADRISE